MGREGNCDTTDLRPGHARICLACGQRCEMLVAHRSDDACLTQGDPRVLNTREVFCPHFQPRKCESQPNAKCTR